ncbi:STAS/SEC14 domain-containing protein [Rhodococcus opacus]|nr:STAS/SEC14 domain-containing protein [Rhodococcus opacus]
MEVIGDDQLLLPSGRGPVPPLGDLARQPRTLVKPVGPPQDCWVPWTCPPPVFATAAERLGRSTPPDWSPALGSSHARTDRRAARRGHRVRGGRPTRGVRLRRCADACSPRGLEPRRGDQDRVGVRAVRRDVSGAAWEDLELGTEHLTRWKRIALVTDLDWMIAFTSLFGWMTPGEFKRFPVAARDDAIAWAADVSG